ncbi:MAG: hypothetical protein GC154_05875 [bacterium]|nr:hypothetical protein [bacterium]
MNVNPEEQPRYKIDDGGVASDVKVLSHEQSAALQKLLANAGHVLSGEERDVVIRLVEKLDQETERVHQLRKMTIADRPLDSYLSKSKNKNQHKAEPKLKAGVKLGTHGAEEIPEEELEEQPEEKKVQHIVGFKPEEVVQRYIECWNQQKFGAEFDCFSSDFMRIDRQQYIDARHASYQQHLGQGGLRVTFERIDSSDVIGGEAEVTAVKSVKSGPKPAREEVDLYRLKLEHGRWVIYNVQPQ